MLAARHYTAHLNVACAPIYRRPSIGSPLSVENERRDGRQPALEGRGLCLEKRGVLKLE
jgi:hypothetical protein